MSTKPGESNTQIPTLTKPIYSFTVPGSARQYQKDPKTFKIEAWNTGTELDARRVSEKNNSSLDFEIFQRACIEIDGKPADQAMDLTAEWGPKARRFAEKAIAHVGLPSAQEDKDFFASVIQS